MNYSKFVLITLITLISGTEIIEKDSSTEFFAPNTIKLVNKTGYPLMISLKYKDLDGDWVIKHYRVSAGYTKTCCKTKNRIVYYYAAHANGYNVQTRRGESLNRNYWGTMVSFTKKTFSSLKNPRVVLTEDNVW